MNETMPKRDAFRIAVRLVDNERKSLAEAGGDEEVLQALESIVKFLYRMPDHQIARLMGDRQAKPLALRRDAAIKSAESLSLRDVEQTLSDGNTSRVDLEAIAIGRFHVPRGSMRSLGNMELLRDKILTFVENEKTHEAITELARKSS